MVVQKRTEAGMDGWIADPVAGCTVNRAYINNFNLYPVYCGMPPFA